MREERVPRQRKGCLLEKRTNIAENVLRCLLLASLSLKSLFRGNLKEADYISCRFHKSFCIFSTISCLSWFFKNFYASWPMSWGGFLEINWRCPPKPGPGGPIFSCTRSRVWVCILNDGYLLLAFIYHYTKFWLMWFN